MWNETALNALPLLDNEMADMFLKLKPHYSIPDLSKPYSVSGNLNLFSPSNNILANFLSDKSELSGEDKIINML